MVSEEKINQKIEEISIDIDENYEKAQELLINYFKQLFENVGMEWTETSKKDIKFIMGSMVMKSVSISGEVIGKSLFPEENNKK